MNDLESGQLLCLRCDDLPWKLSTFAAGVFVKDVAVTGGLEMQIVRFAPGARLPLHTHGSVRRLRWLVALQAGD